MSQQAQKSPPKLGQKQQQQQQQQQPPPKQDQVKAYVFPLSSSFPFFLSPQSSAIFRFHRYATVETVEEDVVAEVDSG